MFCYRCGCQLSEHDFCTACGADVSLYKKIMYASNQLYNDGLEKAGVRDLTGAVHSLRQSLKFNKNNVDARNLLGLIYFEMGEVVAALSEWVISKNLRPEKNIADDYMNALQSGARNLDSINQTIKKYNQAYTFCLQDSKDLAQIQLKQVLSLNPKFIRAHQLLALLYIDNEQWEAARKELRRCMEIDRNNTLTLRYLQEVDRMLEPDENMRQPVKRKKDNTLRYQSDNDLIIQPVDVKESKGGGITILLNIGIGLVIGLATCYFLVVPTKVTEARNQEKKGVAEIVNQLDTKTSTIKDLESQIATLKNQAEDLSQELEGYVGEDGTLRTIDNLLVAATGYLETQNLQETAQNLEAIDAAVNVDETSKAFQDLYYTLLNTIGPELSETYHTDGFAAYRSEDYPTAIDLLAKAFHYDNTNEQALYDLGMAYRKSEDRENAIEVFQKVIELFPDTPRARNAQNNLNDMGVESD